MYDRADLSRALRLFLRTYRWRRIKDSPWATPERPLSEARVALVSTAGFVLPDQPPFDATIRGGDYSFRIVPSGADTSTFIDAHRSKSYDHSGLLADPNLGFPLDRLHELAAAGSIGEVAPRHLSYMGSITAPGRLIRRTAPEGAEILRDDGVDAVLLVPV